MRTILLSIALLFMSSFALFAEEKAEDKKPAAAPARLLAIAIKAPGFPKARPTQPTVITSKEELAAALPDKETQEAVLKEVDLAKEQLIYFAWAGSGQDQIVVDEEKSKEGEVIFRYKPGRTRDLRPHHRLYAMTTGGKWQVLAGK